MTYFIRMELPGGGDAQVEVPGRVNLPAHIAAKANQNGGVIEDYFTLDRRVPDVTRGKLAISGTQVTLVLALQPHAALPHSRFNDCPAARHPNGTVVLILESPHKSEYCYTSKNCIATDLKPKAPLMGGFIQSQIENGLTVIHGKSPLSQDMRLIVANPVQYQASLHFINEDPASGKLIFDGSARDRVWRDIFANQAIQDDFVERLSSYQPSVIINACTGAVSEDVSDVLRVHNCLGVPAWDTHHPARSQWKAFKKCDGICYECNGGS